MVHYLDLDEMAGICRAFQGSPAKTTNFQFDTATKALAITGVAWTILKDLVKAYQWGTKKRQSRKKEDLERGRANPDQFVKAAEAKVIADDAALFKKRMDEIEVIQTEGREDRRCGIQIFVCLPGLSPVLDTGERGGGCAGIARSAGDRRSMSNSMSRTGQPVLLDVRNSYFSTAEPAMGTQPNSSQEFCQAYPNNAHYSNQHQISGSMHIQFEDCFLRVKRGNESDFVLSNDDMTEIAEAI